MCSPRRVSQLVFLRESITLEHVRIISSGGHIVVGCIVDEPIVILRPYVVLLRYAGRTRLQVVVDARGEKVVSLDGSLCSLVLSLILQK